MSDDFKWEKHCSEAVRKDNRVIVIVIIIIITDLYSTFRSEDTEALNETSLYRQQNRIDATKASNVDSFYRTWLCYVCLSVCHTPIMRQN